MRPVVGPDGADHHQLPGAVPDATGGCTFTVWAPRASAVRLHLQETDLEPGPGGKEELPMEATGDGTFCLHLPVCPSGTRYRFGLDSGEPLPDPASRWQPEGIAGPSAVFDAAAHRWTDHGFVAPPRWRLVTYELHVGTFTPAGTFAAAAAALDALVELGVTAVEVMPVAQFPGRWNWGYDGVFPYAVQDSYGGPAGLQAFVDACHALGLAVILDVVYNHLGPEGNVLPAFAPYFTDCYRTPWGAAVNVDGPYSDEVRRYLIGNALMWLGDFHIDGLRIDAIHSIVDTTAIPFLSELSEAVDRFAAETGHHHLLIAESADNDPRVVGSRSGGGLGMGAQWNDDFHHAIHAALTGEYVGYYCDFGSLDQVARTMVEGFWFQGGYSSFRGRRHGAPPVGIPADRLVTFVQNHDHVGNRPAGDRLSSLVPLGATRLAAAAAILSPGLPLLFMGEEYGERAPFPYFVDHGDCDLRDAVRTGRAREMADLGLPGPSLDPTDPATREMAVLDPSQRSTDPGRGLFELYQGLIRFRAAHALFGGAATPTRHLDAWVDRSVVVLMRTDDWGEAAVLFNFSPEPVTVVPPGHPSAAGNARSAGWAVTLDAGDPALGGSGRSTTLDADGGFRLDGYGFAVLEWAAHAPVGPVPWGGS